ncbi:MAG: hypothetical protein CBC79_05540 [Gammaproteobacteria bacterium TMED119]|nr:MAG: hypothetical protein CBC79_05540 [Gammaproteobacteria bacterium TMED119]
MITWDPPARQLEPLERIQATQIDASYHLWTKQSVYQLDAICEFWNYSHPQRTCETNIFGFA